MSRGLVKPQAVGSPQPGVKLDSGAAQRYCGPRTGTIVRHTPFCSARVSTLPSKLTVNWPPHMPTGVAPSEGHEVGEQAARRIGHVGHDERTTGAVPEEHTVDGHVGVDPSVGLTATGQRLVLGTAEGETHQPHVLGTRGSVVSM